MLFEPLPPELPERPKKSLVGTAKADETKERYRNATRTDLENILIGEDLLSEQMNNRCLRNERNALIACWDVQIPGEERMKATPGRGTREALGNGLRARATKAGEEGRRGNVKKGPRGRRAWSYTVLPRCSRALAAKPGCRLEQTRIALLS